MNWPTWPNGWQWPFAKRRAAASAAPQRPDEAAVATQAEPDPPEPEEDDLLARMANASWRLLLVAVVIALVVWAVVHVRVVTLPLILAVFVTALLMPAANWMRRKGLGRGSSTAISIVGSLIVLGGVITLIVQPAVSGAEGLVTSVEQAIDGLPGYLQAFGLDPQLVNTTIAAAEREVQTALQEDWSSWVTQAWVAGTTVLEILLGIILVFVLTVYFVHSGDRLVAWVLSLFPAGSRRSLGSAGEIAYGVMGRYVRGVALVGFIDAVGIGIFLVFLIDPALAIPLIVLTFIGAFLPVIGAFLSGLLAAMVALVTEGWVIALVVVAGVLIVQQLESHVFAPRVYGAALDLPSAVVLLGITLGGILGGITGMFLATPVIAVIAALLHDRPFARREPGPEAASEADSGPPPGAGPETAPAAVGASAPTPETTPAAENGATAGSGPEKPAKPAAKKPAAKKTQPRKK
ncbi:AI-2E family transporter [Nocardiopsis sediminis]|uniref:AI-2E family transporter n=1 Tax=Nocardiopsis sediminis TaxID=1778267 RepID=A0ABV8FT50_9ACTN